MIALAQHLRNSRLPGVTLWVVVCLLGVAVAFHWLREAAATEPPSTVVPPRAAIDLQAAIAQAATAPLFGEAPPSGSAAIAESAPLDIKLKGVVAGHGGPAAAIVNTGGEEDELAMPGAEIRAGVKLESVERTHVVVSRDGVTLRVELEPVRNESSRSKGGSHASGKRALHSPPQPAAAEGEVPATGAEPAAEQPLAPPMPQSGIAPDSLTPVA
ncbi:MAG: type II secretion system protein N [Burkholderiales bacterium]